MTSGNQKKDGDGRAPEPEKPGLTIDVVLPDGTPPAAEPDWLEKPDDEETRKKDEMLRRHGVPPQTTG